MKDTLITARTKKRELTILLGCFVAANIINSVCIAVYSTRWIEMLSQMGYVVFVTVGLYGITWIARLLAQPFCRRRRH